MMEQWHIFGDGTTMIRTRKPERPVVEIKTESIPGESQAIVTVAVNGKPVADARVTCYTGRLELCSTATTNKDGVARVNIGLEKGAEAFITVFGSDLVPVVDKKIKF
jgi:hypothetical protein